MLNIHLVSVLGVFTAGIWRIAVFAATHWKFDTSRVIAGQAQSPASVVKVAGIDVLVEKACNVVAFVALHYVRGGSPSYNLALIFSFLSAPQA